MGSRLGEQQSGREDVDPKTATRSVLITDIGILHENFPQCYKMVIKFNKILSTVNIVSTAISQADA